MNLLKLVSVCVLYLLPLLSDAQIFPEKNYPQGYFQWPVGAVKALAANFGELRPNHYHMGLDCKTDQRENVPVYAAAEGYIAKVKIEPSGFGRAIYINHPNGLTTLYAHLNDFNPALEKYVTEQQYKLKSWKVFIDIPSNLFPVNKGQFVAYSGNTGGSQGPHLHFEIRDTKTDKVLNPLLMGFEVTDNIAPDILRLALYDRNRSMFEQSAKFIGVRKVNGIYVTTPALIRANTDRVSFAISSFDRYTGSTNKNGIYEADLYEDDKAVVGFQLDSISYDETRYLNAHIDYTLKSNGGPFVQHLSRLPGYPKGVYKEVSGNGVIDLTDGEVHHMSIKVKDTYGNTSILNFDVQLSESATNITKNPSAVYHDKRVFHPGFVNVFENEHIHFYLPEICLYDSVKASCKETPSASGNSVFMIQNGATPCHSKFPVAIKKTDAADPDKIVMHRFWGAKDDFAKAAPVSYGNEHDWYQASFREFGNYQLMEDEEPPVVSPVGFRDGMNCSGLSRIAFVIKDNSEELMNFTALLDGEWLRFSNDKGRTFIYKFDEHCPAGEHELKISVEDCVGNRTMRIYHFTR